MRIQRRFDLLVLLSLLVCGLASCSAGRPILTPLQDGTPAQLSPTPAGAPAAPLPAAAQAISDFPLPAEDGFYLASAGQVIPLLPQHLSESESISAQGVPRSLDPLPGLLFRQAGLEAQQPRLQRMIGGIGISDERDTAAGGMQVRLVRPGFGAARAGLLPGDRIVTVDGQPLQDLIREDDYRDRLGELITGELGSQVRLTIRRQGRTLDLDVRRDMPTLWGMDHPLAYSLVPRQMGFFQAVVPQALPPGMYCLQVGWTASTAGDFYCFLQGNLETAWVQAAESRPSPTPARDGTPSPSNLQPVACRFPVQAGQQVDCFDLLVPEEVGRPQEKLIRLHGGIFHHGPATRPDPVILLHGGPGGGALEWIANAVASGFLSLFPGRDLVVYDQRGAGYSQPRLNCPDLALEFSLSLSEDQRMSQVGWGAAHLEACWEQLAGRGVDLSAYSTAANTADLDALISALGARQVNLFGQSYGTYLGLSYLRDYGAQGRLRSLVLAGVEPAQTNLLLTRGANAQSAWKALFAACAADPACRSAYPDLENQFYRLLKRLAASPVTLQVNNPFNGQSQAVVLNDFRLLELVYRSSYRSSWLPRLPRLISSLDAGEATLAVKAWTNVMDAAVMVDDGVYYAILCSDVGRSTSREAVRAANQDLEDPFEAYFNQTAEAVLDLCQGWPSAASLHPGGAASSATPVLLLSGALDPATPPHLGQMAAQTLDQALVYTFPSVSHDFLLGTPCDGEIIYHFMDRLEVPAGGCQPGEGRLDFELP